MNTANWGITTAGAAVLVAVLVVAPWQTGREPVGDGSQAAAAPSQVRPAWSQVQRMPRDDDYRLTGVATPPTIGGARQYTF